MKLSRMYEVNRLLPTRFSLCVGLAALLSACGGDSLPENTQASIAIPTEVRPSVSAAQLANDATNTLSFAQAVGAGVADAADANTATSDSESTNVVGTGINSIAAAQNSVGANTTNSSGTTQQPIPSATNETNSNESETASNGVTEGDSSSNSSDPESVAQGAFDNTEQELIEQREFEATTTAGFVGEVRDDGSVRVSWQVDPTARGYNIYRQAEYIETVFTNEYIHSDPYDEDYYYEIEAFDFADNFSRIATGLTVKVRNTGRINPNALVAESSLLDDYELVFSDEFNGTELDTSKWNTSYIWGDDLIINSEEQFYVDIVNKPDFGFNPFELDGENLVIKSIKTPPNLLSAAQNQPYLSGVITSYDAFKMTYGFVEARVQVVSGRGYWPAFWLLNAYYDQDKPEIDIMEHIGDDQDVVYHTYHYYDADGELRSTEAEPTVGIDFPADFHTYAVDWSPGRIIFYVNGIERHRIEDPKVSSEQMYIIANAALGGWWAGSPDVTTPFPGEYKIDYIRAYQKVGIQEDMPQFDSPDSNIPDATTLPGQAPNHIPPAHLWPEGYPELQ